MLVLSTSYTRDTHTMKLPASFENALKLPIVAAPMFLVSGVNLVVACCEQGIVGTLPALNHRTSEGFDQWLGEIEARLQAFRDQGGQPAPFGVNLVVHKTNKRIEQDLATLVRHKVPLVITSLGAAREVVDAVHSYGGVVFHDVTNRRHAQKAAEAGVDGIIAVCGGAGGHAGKLNPFALLSEIRAVFDGTVLLAGCINTGSDVAAALQMGADLVYMGTRFINTLESEAQADYRQMIIDCQAEDIIHTPAVSGVAASFMRPSLERAGYDMARLLNPVGVDYGSLLKPIDEEAKAWKTVWSAGQGVSGISDVVSVAALAQRLRQELKTALERQAELARFV